MKYHRILSIKSILLFSSIVLLSSCALKAITSEYTFVQTNIEKVELDNLKEGEILIYNGANVLYKIDNTAPVA